MKTECANCGKELERKPCRMKNRNYCNTTCQNKYEYKNGIKDKQKIANKARETKRERLINEFKTKPKIHIGKRGYKIICIPWEKNKYYHQYIWEKAYGEIPKGYCLHHINLNKLDNRLENLQIMPIKKHHQLHDKLRKRDSNGRFK